MFETPAAKRPFLERWFAPAFPPGEASLVARWLFLRALGLIFFSAFYSLLFQIDGLIGPAGILPAADYLSGLRRAIGVKALWVAPTLLWINASSAMLIALVVIGMLASLALVANVRPRVSIAVAAIAFVSFIGAAQDFASYQSDGMLLEAAFLSLFLAPRGLRPRLGFDQPPSRAAVFLLRWEWFRIYFESGLVKILSGEQQWRDLTAMDKYYENGPLPTWIGWYVQHLPHAFHAATAAATLVIELFVVLLMFFPGRWPRAFCFAVTSLLQIGIILTANYAFLNYLVLAFGILLVDDGMVRAVLEGLRKGSGRRGPLHDRNGGADETSAPQAETSVARTGRSSLVAAIVLPLHFVTTSLMFFFPAFPLAIAAEPLRIVNNFGLFAVMTRARYEIEFQGTRDGRTWTPYAFRYKPQDVRERPGIYAPYQPRFEWNLWFASLDTVNDNPWVLNVEARLLQGSPAVLRLFRSNPFGPTPPAAVRAVLWQYWFTTFEERARSGAWWNRELQGLYAPIAHRTERGIEFAGMVTER